VRIATVAQRIDGPNPGFILVGRSLTLVQQQENALRRGTFITWFVLMGLLALGAVFLNRAQSRQVPAS
jgi:sensor histidine kinase regulating citrate/malate metabolism